MKVFITGCGSGFGRALAVALLRRGDPVCATNPVIEGLAEELSAEAGGLGVLQVLPLDVADDAQVAAAAAAAGPIDVLVNNAGYAYFGTLEEGSPEDFRRLLDVNVVGVHRLTRAFLPSLRRRRGTVVMLSSIAGRTVFPESGFYAASKHAVEALGEALFQETCRAGVRVRLIEPGSFDTNFLPYALSVSVPRVPDSPYAADRPAWDARKLEVLEPPQDPELVVRAILASLDDPIPFLRVPVGADAHRILGVRDALSPDAWTRLAAARLGFFGERRRPGDVLSPAEVLVASERELGPTLAAWAGGHLAHWAEEGGDGADALRRLAAVATGRTLTID